MLRRLLSLGAGTVVYFDPGMAVFHPLASLARHMESASILLTPGEAGPGFLAARNDTTGRAFADEWAARPDAPDASRFGRVGLVSDPGWNVAGWNLSRRKIRFGADGGIGVDGSPLAFFHFSGHAAGEASEPEELWRWYARRLAARAEPGIPPDWWHFSTFSDGTKIPPAARRLAHARPDLMARFADPFDVAGDSFFRWLAAEAPAVLG
jgi:hypothetical protein